MLAAPAIAQDANGSTSDQTGVESSKKMLEEVIVTALKGATGTALSDTAMGINALEGVYLEEVGRNQYQCHH